MHLLKVVSLTAAIALAGCNFQATLPAENPTLNAEAEAMFEDLAAGRDQALLARLSSENKPEVVSAQLPVLKNLIGNASPPKPKVTGYQQTNSTQGKFYAVAQDYAYADRVAHVQTNFVQRDGAWKVLGFNVNVTMTAAPPPPVSAAPAAQAN